MAGAQGRAGRIQRIAQDRTPAGSLNPDVDARVGWLLAMSRLYSPFAEGRDFLAAATEHGLAVTRSAVSRWESGEIPAPFEALTAYETVLRLRPGALSGVVAYLRTAVPSRGPVRPALDVAAPAFALGLDQLLDRAEDGLATATDWQQLGWHAAAVPHLHLRQHTWQSLSRRLVEALGRSAGLDSVLLSNAVADLGVAPRAADFLLSAIAEYVADPDCQSLTAPFKAVLRLRHPRAADLALDAFEAPRTPPMFPLSVSMVAELVVRGDLTDDQRARLGMQVLRQWRADPDRSARWLAELISVLPEGLRAPLTDAADRSGQEALPYAVEHGEAPALTRARLSTDLPAEPATELAAELAAGAAGRTPGDPVHAEDRMLPRLIRELLFHRHQERRHLATLLIAASPFAGGVCDELLSLLADDRRSGGVRLTAAWAVRYVANEAHRLRILRLMDHRDELVAAPVTLALSHLARDGVSDQVLRHALGRTVTHQGRAAMFCLGMTGSPSIASLARSSTAPEWQRRAARWWEANGPTARR